MKKLFYIVLVIVALMVISRFVKERGQNVATPSVTEQEASEPVTATLPDVNCICDAGPACQPGDADCDDTATKSTCNCQQANGETVTIEQTIEDVEEINPDETAGDDETIVNDEVVPAAAETPAAEVKPETK